MLRFGSPVRYRLLSAFGAQTPGGNLAHDHPEPKPYPVSPDFIVDWPVPEDFHKRRMYDRMHAPEPTTPMTGWISANPWTEGTARGFKNAGQPITLMCDRFNTYYLNAAVPTVPPEDMEEAGAHAGRQC